MKKIIFILLTFLVGCGNSTDTKDDYATSVAGHAIPACFDNYHKRVRVKETQSTEGGPAYSTLSHGLPTIFFNQTFMQSIAHSAAMVMFVYEHECGHHALGHIEEGQTAQGSLSQKNHFKQELDADCYAAQKLREMGYTSKDITSIIDDVYPWPKDPEHPSGKVRSQHVASCFKSAGE
jgi:hypothetical protein